MVKSQKGKRQRHPAEGDNSAEDEAVLSGGSDLSEEETEGYHHHGLHAIEVEQKLTDKRSWVRVEILEHLLDFFQRFTEDVVNLDYHALVECFLRGPLHKGDDAEYDLACKVLSAMFVYAEGRDDLSSTLPKVRDHLLQKPTPEALGAMSLTCFVAADHDEDTLEVMEKLEKYIMKKYPATALQRAAAVRGWSLLATTLDPTMLQERVAGEKGIPVGVYLRRLATRSTGSKKDVIEVKLAATEALTIILEAGFSVPSDHEEDEDAYSDADEEQSHASESHASSTKQQQTSPTSPPTFTMDSVQSALHHIAGGSGATGKRVPMKEREGLKEQTLDADMTSAPLVRFDILNREKVHIEGFGAKRRLDAYRHVLGGGLPEHMAYNTLVRDTFDLGPPMVRGSSAVPNSRRHTRAAARESKSRTKNLTSNRTSRTATSESFHH